jgi:hypothetical protein
LNQSEAAVSAASWWGVNKGIGGQEATVGDIKNKK